MSALLSILIASYYSIERLALKYFPYVQQDHKLNETGIIYHLKLASSIVNIASVAYQGQINELKVRLCDA